MKSTLVNIAKTAVLALVSILAPAGQALATTLLLCFVDLVTGLLASRKTSLPITSNGLKKTVIKLIVYMAAILLSFLVQTYLMGPFMPVMTFVTSMIGITELTSIFENINIVAGGSLLTSIISSIQKKTNNNPE